MMPPSFRLVHFSPDPFTGSRFALGAIFVGARGEVLTAKAAHSPSPACLGSRELAITARRIIGRLDMIESAHSLPAAFGPYVSLGQMRRVPEGVADPIAWLEAMLARTAPSDGLAGPPRSPHRQTLGYRFFETWRVNKYVKRSFRPESDWDAWLRPHATALPQLSHWVAGPREVLLMEPVLPSRPHFEEELKEIAQGFLAYRFALEHASNGRSGRLVAYVMAGGGQSRRERAFEVLTTAANSVVDTVDEVQRDTFVNDIRRIGSASDPQATAFDF